MRQTLVSLVAMFASLALLVAGSSLLGTLLSVRLSIEGFAPFTIGAILVFHSIGFVIGTRLAPRVIRRVGQVRSFAAFAAFACVASLLHPLFLSGWLWAALRMLVGFCAAGLIMVLESWISGRASNSSRGALLGIYQIVYFSSAALGQFLVGTSDPGEYPVYSLVAILLVLSLVPLSLTREEAPSLGPVSRLRFANLYALSPSALLAGTFAGIAVSAFLALGPLYGHATGMSISGVSRYMLMAVLATMIVQWPMGILSDNMDRRRLLGMVAALAALFAVLAAALGQVSPWLLYLATAGVFAIAGCLYPIALSMLNDNMETGNPVAASAGLLYVYGIGTCLGPLAGSAFMALLGPVGLFMFLAVCFVLLAGYVAIRIRTTPDLPMDEQGPHVVISAAEAAPALLELDPRNDTGP